MTKKMEKNTSILDYVEEPTVFRDERYLVPDFPIDQLDETRVLYRNDEKATLYRHIYSKPFQKKNRGLNNMFISGDSGSGKTYTILALNEEFNHLAARKKIDAQAHYISCEKKKTEFRIILDLCRAYNEKTPARGWDTSHYYDVLYAELNKRNNPCVIVLDEVDALLQNDGDGLLYNLLRAPAHGDLKHKPGIICIANHPSVFKKNIRAKVRSSFGEDQWLLFRRYTPEELLGILNWRVGKAFKSKAIQPAAISLAAALGAKSGDARKAQRLLLSAGKHADKLNTKTVTPEHVKIQKKRVEVDLVKETITQIREESRLFVLYALVDLLDRGGKKEVKLEHIWNNYCAIMSEKFKNETQLSNRQVRRTLYEFSRNIISRYTDEDAHGHPIYFTLDGKPQIFKEAIQSALHLDK